MTVEYVLAFVMYYRYSCSSTQDSQRKLRLSAIVLTQMPLRHVDVSKISAWNWQISPRSCHNHVLLEVEKSSLGSLKWIFLKQLKLAQVTRDTEGKRRKVTSKMQPAAVLNCFEYRFLHPSDSDPFPSNPFLSLYTSAIFIQMHYVWIYVTLQLFPSSLS